MVAVLPERRHAVFFGGLFGTHYLTVFHDKGDFARFAELVDVRERINLHGDHVGDFSGCDGTEAVTAA